MENVFYVIIAALSPLLTVISDSLAGGKWSLQKSLPVTSITSKSRCCLVQRDCEEGESQGDETEVITMT